jgi:hypothetical protein
MKKVATLLCLTQLLCMGTALAGEKYLSAWIVATPGNNPITNFDITEFAELTQISDAMKIALFKQAKGDFSKYQELKSKVANKYFKTSSSQLIYAKMMKEDHKRKHGSKRVAFNATEREFFDVIQDNEDKILKDLLESGIGIVKSRAKYGDFLIKNDYPHKSSESNSDVYWRHYEDQKARTKVEFLLREVKKYESYIARKDERYYFQRPGDVQDFYRDTKKDIESNLNGKKYSHKQLLTTLKSEREWNIVIDKVSNAQLDTTPVKDLKKEAILVESANTGLTKITGSDWKRVTSYHTKTRAFINKYKTASALEEKAKSYLETYILNKANHTSYMLSLISKLSAKVVETKSAKELDAKALKMSSHLLSTLKDFQADLGKNKSRFTLEKEIEKALYASIDMTSLDEVEKALSELIIYSIKFQMKKSIAENTIPVRVTYKKYGTFELHDKINNYKKFQWMQTQYNDYINKEMRWQFEYVIIRLSENETLRNEKAEEFILGKRK